MANTSVKDVGSLLSGVGGTLPGQGAQMNVPTGQNSFDAVFKKQTNGFDKQETNVAFDRKNSSVKVKNSKKQEQLGETKQQDALKGAEDATEEDKTKAYAEANGFVMQFMQDIADSFGVSVEDLQAQMDELGMQSMDLLDADALGKLILTMGNAADSLSLLTNEGLYEDFQRMMSEREDFISQLSDRLQMTPGELEKVLQKMSELGQSEDIMELSEDFLSELPGTGEESDDYLVNGNGQLDGNAAEVMNERKANASAETESDGRQSQHGEGDHSQVSANLVLEQTLQDGTQVTTEFTMENPGTLGTDTENIMRQIMDHMRVQLKPDISEMEMQLHPASLGTLQVQVASKNGVLTAQFVTQSEAVKAALEGQMIQLKENFEEQGIKVEAIEVSVQTQQFDRNLQQNQNQGQETQSQRGRTRRIRLDGNVDESVFEDMDEEDILAAKVMEANGNTVDFMA